MHDRATLLATSAGTTATRYADLQLFRSGCTADSDLNGWDSRYCKIDSVSVSGQKVEGRPCGSVKAVIGRQFNFNYRASGTEGGETISVWRGSTQEACGNDYVPPALSAPGPK